MSCDSLIDQKIKGNLMADTFSMLMVVPLENWPVYDLTAKSGMQYGAYFKNSEKHKWKFMKFRTDPDFL